MQLFYHFMSPKAVTCKKKKMSLLNNMATYSCNVVHYIVVVVVFF